MNAMSNNLRELIAFGEYRLDAATRLLTKGGEAIALPPKAFDLLVILAESGGRLLTKRELMDALWPDVAVEEANLSFQISTLRKMLGEQGDVWIETVPKYGYRFTAPVEMQSPPEEHTEVALSVAPILQRSRPKTWSAVAGALAILAVAAGFTLKRFSNATPEAAPIRFTVEAPEGVSMPEYSWPALSPDGRKLLFTAIPNGSQTPSLYVRELALPEAKLLPGTEGATLAFWSPDSRSVAFFAGNKLAALDLVRGSTTFLCRTEKGGGGGTWAEDGTILFSDVDGLRRVPASGGACQEEQIGGIGRPVTPAFLRGGRRFLFSVHAAEPARSGIYAGELGSGKVKRLAPVGWHPQFVSPGLLLMTLYGDLLAQRFDANRLELIGEPVKLIDSVALADGFDPGSLYSVSQNRVIAWREGEPPAGQLAWYDRSGSRSAVGEELPMSRQVALSPDGKWAAVEKRDPATRTWDVWLFNLQSLVLSRVTTYAGDDTDPVWSPDSKSLVFSSDRKGPGDLYVRSIGGIRDELLYADAARKVPESWASDGSIVFGRSHNRVAVVSADGRKMQPVLETEFLVDEYRVSPDGRWVAYNSTESGEFQVYVAAFPSFTNRRQVSTGGGTQPHWRGDGNELYYLSREGYMMAVEMKLGTAPEAGRPRSLFKTRVRPNGMTDQYGVTADGQRFLLIEPAHEPRPKINVLVNWREALAPKL